MKRVFASLLLAALFLTGCSRDTAVTTQPTETQPDQGKAVSATVFAMDTVMDLTIYGDEDLLIQAEQYIMQLESSLSVTDENSEIYRLNQTGTIDLSEDAARLLEQGLELCRMTNGALDLSIYPVLRAWGFTTGEYQVPQKDEIAELLKYVDYKDILFGGGSGTVSLENGMKIDLGSVAKGYTGDRLAQMFKENGVTSGLLNLGGNVQTIGAKPDGSPWRVAIQDPESSDNLAVLEVVDKAVITSGGYERYFEEDGQVYWHILDPDTGHPAHSGVISATIVGESGVLCDGLSTGLFVMGVENAAELWRENKSFEAVLVTEDDCIYITQGLEDDFSLLGSAAAKYTVEVIR